MLKTSFLYDYKSTMSMIAEVLHKQFKFAFTYYYFSFLTHLIMIANRIGTNQKIHIFYIIFSWQIVIKNKMKLISELKHPNGLKVYLAASLVKIHIDISEERGKYFYYFEY